MPPLLKPSSTSASASRCAPEERNQKGSVERLVGWVKSSFFKHRSSKTWRTSDAARCLASRGQHEDTLASQWRDPEIRRQEEPACLRPIRRSGKLALRMPIFVGPTAEAMFEGVAYSMPPGATHVAGTLFLYEDQVRIVAGRFECEHRRRKTGEPPSLLPEHRAAEIAAVHGARIARS